MKNCKKLLINTKLIYFLKICNKKINLNKCSTYKIKTWNKKKK